MDCFFRCLSGTEIIYFHLTIQIPTQSNGQRAWFLLREVVFPLSFSRCLEVSFLLFTDSQAAPSAIEDFSSTHSIILYKFLGK